MLPETTDVLIVGAGPTGLALAIARQQAGGDHLLVEKSERAQKTSRAAVIHAHTLEVLEPLGVVEALGRRGLHLEKFAMRDGDAALLHLSFDRLPSRYREILMIPQDETEAVLVDRLHALGGKIHRGVAVTSVVGTDGRHDVHVQSANGETMVSAAYVVAGDGMHSVVRESAGIGFEGEAYEGSFVLADITMDTAIKADEVAFFLSPEGPVVVAPLPRGRFRIVAAVENAPEKPDADLIEQILNTRGPRRQRTTVHGVTWSSRFRLHHRVASAYRKGNIFLMGDAAHVHSPAGGQGMNTGLVDAVVLGRLLSDVISGRRPASDLDRYQALRRPAALEVVALADRLTRIALVRNPAGKFLRRIAFKLLDMSSAFKAKIELSLSGLDRKAHAEIPD